MFSKNSFNGYYLLYNISKNFIKDVERVVGTSEIKCFDESKKEVVLIENRRLIVPLGIFSNDGFVLKCEWLDTTRNFMIKAPTIKSNIELTDVQKIIIKKFTDTLEKITEINKSPVYINMVGDCSIGKTVMSLKIIDIYKFKTIVITPSIDLAKQWGNSIKNFLPECDYNVSVSGAASLLKKMNKSPDILIFPSKHLSNKEFVDYISNNYTMCFIDEQHVYNFETNKPMKEFFSFVGFPFVISLTATPRKINSFYLGKELLLEDIIQEHKIKKFKKEAYEVVLSKSVKKNTLSHYYDSYKKLLIKSSKSQNDISMLSILKKRSLSDDILRISAITKNIKKTFLENSKIIVLVHFVDDISTIYTNLILSGIDEKKIFKVYASESSTSKESLENVKISVKTENNYIIIGTEDHIGTGIDIKELSIMHLFGVTTNKTKLIQWAGRVSRDNEETVHELYYYNICSHPAINIKNDCDKMREILIYKKWNYNKKMILD